jgi:hypothetical protein
MKDVSEYESWFLGEPEIRLQIMSPLGTNGSSILDVMYTMSRGAIEDHWYCNTQLYYWNKATITNTVGYLWVEQDGGDEIDVKLTLGYKTDKDLNASTEVTYKMTTRLARCRWTSTSVPQKATIRVAHRALENSIGF